MSKSGISQMEGAQERATLAKDIPITDLSSDMTAGTTNLTTADLSTQQESLRSWSRIFDCVMRDHEHIRSLFKNFQAANSDEARIPILNSIIRILSIHAATEELILYPAFDKAGFNAFHDKGRDDHQQVKDLLDAVDGSSTISAENLSQILTVFADVETHAQWEETNALPVLRDNCSKECLEKLASDWEKQWCGAPTHPHPMAPNDGGIAQAAAGKMAAPLDALKDSQRTFVDDDYIKMHSKCETCK